MLVWNFRFLFNKTQRDQEINFEELKDYVNNVSVIINNINEVNKNEIKFNEDLKNKNCFLWKFDMNLNWNSKNFLFYSI